MSQHPCGNKEIQPWVDWFRRNRSVHWNQFPSAPISRRVPVMSACVIAWPDVSGQSNRGRTRVTGIKPVPTRLFIFESHGPIVAVRSAERCVLGGCVLGRYDRGAIGDCRKPPGFYCCVKPEDWGWEFLRGCGFQPQITGARCPSQFLMNPMS